MAVVRPVQVDTNNNIKELTDTEIGYLVEEAAYRYIINQSVTLTVDAENNGSPTSIGAMSDTRLMAGGSSTGTADYPAETTTAEPVTKTVTYDRVNYNYEDATSAPAPTAIGSTGFWLYYDGSGNLKEMSAADVVDTIVGPAMAVVQSYGPYKVTTSNTADTDYESQFYIFQDTRADTALYTSDGIPEAVDQPKTITTYYLHKRTNASNSSTLPLLLYYTSGNIRQHSTSSTLSDFMRHYASQVAGYKLEYGINGTGTTHGTMIDTRLNGSGNYQQKYINTDDYRAQEFPDGTSTTISTYNFKVRIV
jgi:hypothetical protein